MSVTPTPITPGQISGNVLFYSQPEPLSFELHKDLGVKSSTSPFSFAKVGHAVPLTVGEFPLASLTGPVIFVGDDKLPLAVMGLSPGENMWVREDGIIEPGAYIPAYIRRYPFVFATDESAGQMVLCIDRSAAFIVDKAQADEPFFLPDGKPSAYTERCISFCNDFEVERQRTAGFVDLLKDLDLFETKIANYQPINADGTPGEVQQIAEYYGISEDKLNALPHSKLAELRDNGALGQIYAHMCSLNGWDRLISVAMSRSIAAANG
jgi:hypothetical protein